LNILLLTSHRKDLVKIWVCQESSPGGSILPPADLASIAASARAGGANVSILDLRLEADPFLALNKKTGEFLPDYVLLNLSTTSANYDYELLRNIPNTIKKIVFGTHAQSNPKECFDNGIDGVMIGDPEAVLQNIIDGTFSLDDAPGMMTRKFPEKKPHYVKYLDSLPFPALDLLQLGSYHAPYIQNNNKFAILLSSRGCPFKCTYCLYPFLFGSVARTRSPKNVADEIEFNLKNFGIKDFYFLDATFNLDMSRVHAICDEIISRNLKVSWICNMRVTPVDEGLLKKMKTAGCRWIFYGVEDQDLLRETKKGTNKNSTVNAFHLTKNANIQTMAFTMVFPRADISEHDYSAFVLNTLKVLDADAFQCNAAIPFPGTEIYNDYKARFPGLSSNWTKYDPHGDELPYSHSQDLIAIKRNIYRSFLFSQPLKVLKVAKQMGFKAFSRQATVFLKKNILPRL
jgi:anaerobic magnesium-protoporphyrin IX monomethyl ester cyclase